MTAFPASRGIEPNPESTRASFAYSALGDLGSRFLFLAGYIVLARFLSPSEFGLVAIASVFIVILDVVIDLGFGPAIIRHDDLTNSLTQTAFWTNTLIGLASAGILFLGAGQAASFFGSPELKAVLEATCVVLVFDGLANVPLSLLRKRREFRRIAMVEVGAGFASLVLGVALALGGFGVYALVAMLIVSSMLRMLLGFIFSRWGPEVRFSKRDFRELAAYGIPLCGTRVYTKVAVSVDQFLIGRMLSTSLLGAYRLAFQIVEIPTQIVAGVLHRVFFSLYAEHGNDRDTIRKAHLLATRSVAFFTFPALLGISALSERIVLVFFGERWIEMAPILAFLAVISLFRNVGVLNDILYLSQGATGLQFKVILVLRSIVILGTVIGVQFGIMGLLWGLLAARAINFFPAYHFSGKLVGISVLESLKNLRGIVGSSLLMVVVLHLLQTWFAAGPGSWAALLLLVVVGATVYLACSFLLIREQCNEILALLIPRFNRDASLEH